jgi:hypothetical protein
LNPTRNPADTFVFYPVSVAVLLAAACTIALATSKARRPVAGLAVVFGFSALLCSFLRHDIVALNVVSLWYPIRGPAFLISFFGVLVAAVLLRALDASRHARLVSVVLAVCGLGLALERSAVLHVHFAEFDRKVHALLNGEVMDGYFRQQPVTYGDHIRAYHCYFNPICHDQSRLFFSILPDATIYPVSPIREPPAAAQ